jgi:exodeoxyribonuclease VIII
VSAVLEHVDAPAEPAAEPAAPFEPGVRDDMPHADYLAVEALSASGIKRMLQSPMHYRFDQDHPAETTEGMLLGTALHMAILEPERYAAEVIAVPADAPKRPTSAQWGAAKPSPASQAAMQWWTEFTAAAAGKVVLTAEQAARVEGMAGSVRRHPIHDEMMGSGASEVSFFWRDARLGIPCKARFDRLNDSGFAFDVKSCQDASRDGFTRAITSFQYHLQNAWYNTGHEHLRDASLRAFLFVAVESSAPYGCAVYIIEPNAIAFGARRCEDAMLLYKQAVDSGYWRGYTETVQPIVLPRWATSIAVSSY